MILPLSLRAAVVKNAMVTETRAFAATRSPAAMVKTTSVSCVDIADAGCCCVPARVESASVNTPAPWAAPSVKPDTVMVKAAPPDIPAPLIKMTTRELVEVTADAEPVIGATLDAPAPKAAAPMK